MKKRILSILLAVCMVMTLLPVVAYAAEPVQTEIGKEIEITFSHEQPTLNGQHHETLEGACMEVKELMLKRMGSVYVTYVTDAYTEDDIYSYLDTMLVYAFAHTGVPKEGDYLAGHVYELGGDIQVTVNPNTGVATIDYLLSADYTDSSMGPQEADNILEKYFRYMGFTDEDTYTKLRVIYEFICENTRYITTEPAASENYYHSANAALRGSATETGIALLFYRMALEMGIDCRIIRGTVDGKDHCWNIVEIDGIYYNVDAALDAGKTDYQYFLKSDADFSNHVRYEEYATEDVYAYYPMAAESMDHTFGEGVVLQECTCQQKGVEVFSCAECGYEYSKYTFSEEHTYDDGVYEEEPSCTTKGEITYSCIHCGLTRQTTVDSLGHDFATGDPIYHAETKSHIRPCSRCEEVQSESCTFEMAVTKEATLDTHGVRTHTCTVCDGSYAEEFVYRIYGKNRYQTAFSTANALKEQLDVEKFDNVVIASGLQFADALAGSYLAAVKNAPILLVNSGSVAEVAEYVKANLAEGGTVYLLGGTAAVPAEMETALKGLTVKRLSGKNRFGTNLAILEEAGTGDEEILVCTGWGFADSLSASAVGKPILLVNTELTEEQKEFLETSSGEFVIIGGTGAVNAQVQGELMEYGSVARLSGKTRYETSVLVAERFFDGPDAVLLAYGQNFPDGLCGGPLAWELGAPLILCANNNSAAADTYVQENAIAKGTVLGGASLISDQTAMDVFTLATAG